MRCLNQNKPKCCYMSWAMSRKLIMQVCTIALNRHTTRWKPRLPSICLKKRSKPI
nr:MAG TPA: hypothetical protein [Caudoviricetes sp.]